MPFISGPYTAAYKSADPGQLKAGFRIVETVHKEDIIGDDFGETIQEQIYLGENVQCLFDLMEHAVALNVLIPYGVWGLIGQVGRQDVASTLAGALVFTAIAGTPAALIPATLTATNAIIAANFDVDLLFSPRLREVPVRMQLLPFTSTGERHFSFT